jgi:hypothetical protein
MKVTVDPRRTSVRDVPDLQAAVRALDVTKAIEAYAKERRAQVRDSQQPSVFGNKLFTDCSSKSEA